MKYFVVGTQFKPKIQCTAYTALHKPFLINNPIKTAFRKSIVRSVEYTRQALSICFVDNVNYCFGMAFNPSTEIP